MSRLSLVGATDLPTAFSRINRVWSDGLRSAGYTLVDHEDASVVIHHDLSQHFLTCRVGPARHRIAVRTWDFGPYPPSWADRIGEDFDRLWVHTSWIREKAVEAGVDPHLVAVVPHGVDTGIFYPHPWSTDHDVFNFVFVGALVTRKGIDILLRAYAKAFSASDPVCLTLKGHAGDIFYRGQHMDDLVREFLEESSNPKLRHIDAYLTDHELAELYRSADAAVFPYRAEGFAIPILEAMACGLPCIVPRFGACLDYCSEDTAYFVKPRRIRFPVRKDFTFNSLGYSEHVEIVDFCEVPVDVLSETLREVFEAPSEERRDRGKKAAETVKRGWTWDHSISRVVHLLSELQCRP